MPSAIPSVDKVGQYLKGQTLRIPNMTEFYSQWPNEISPYFDELKQTIESKIQEWIPDERPRLKATKVNLPIFCAT